VAFPEDRIPLRQQAIAVLWPSFAMAIVASGLFFSAFDPRDLVPFDIDVERDPLTWYSIGFLLFWLFGSLSSAATMYFTVSNCQALHREER